MSETIKIGGVAYELFHQKKIPAKTTWIFPGPEEPDSQEGWYWKRIMPIHYGPFKTRHHAQIAVHEEQIKRAQESIATIREHILPVEAEG